MTLSSSDARWLKPSAVLVAVFVGCVLWAYLAGGIFMLAHQRRFDDATPLTLYQYWFYYGSQKSVQHWLLLSAGIAFAALLVPACFIFAPAKRSLFGNARFARTSEIRKAGLFGDKGIIVGRYQSRFLMFGGSQHVILSAPTRSGKGVGVVIPNLLNWPDSVVVLDVKQENHAITSAYRHRHKQPCFLFNPAAVDYRSHRYNPLSYISADPNFRVDDVQKIANMLFPDQQGTDVIWTATPRALFLGVVLSLLETPGKLVTLGQVLRETLADGDGSKYFADIIYTRALGERIRQSSAADAEQQALTDVRALLTDKGKAVEHHPRLRDMAIWAHVSRPYREAVAERAAAAFHIEGSKVRELPSLLAGVLFDRASAEAGQALSGACIRALNSYISIASENTRAGVMTSFRSRLELWSNPLVDAATSANDFDLRDVRKKRMSVYLGVSPDNLARMAPLLNLFFQQLIDLNTRELPETNPALKYQCLILGDEFTAPGKMSVLSNGIGYIAGYGLRMLPIIQSPSQLVEVYGKDAAQTFTTNHALQVVFPPKASELQTSKDISEWLGFQTVKGKSESKGKNLLTRRERSENVSDQRRALLLPQEITSLGKQRELVVVEDCPPILAEKIRYFADPVFVDRLKSVSPALAALGRRLPSEHQLKKAVTDGELASPVPKIDLQAHQALVGDVVTATVHAPEPASDGGTETIVVERSVTADDVSILDDLTLADFAIDFSTVEAPNGSELDEAALHAYADRLCREAGIAV